MPEMNQARAYASACSLGGHIYVIGGYYKKYLNSIEKFSDPALNKKEAFWQLIQPPRSILYPRRKPAVVPLNGNQIAILGGYFREGCKDLDDVILFNTNTGEYNQAIAKCKINFRAPKNTAALISNNNVVAFVLCEGGFKNRLI